MGICSDGLGCRATEVTRRLKPALLRSLILAGLAAGPALACDCTPMTVCELIQQPTIFIGEVIDGGITSLREDPWRSDFGRVRFKVLESLRGLPRGTRTVDVRLMSPGGMCSPIPYHSGKKYLVVPNEDDGALIDGPCFSARNVVTLTGR